MIEGWCPLEEAWSEIASARRRAVQQAA